METQPQQDRTFSIIRVTILVVALGLLLVVFLPRFGSYSDALSTVQALSGTSAIVVFLLAVLSMASFWLVTAISLPGLSLRRAALVKQSSTALANTVAAGGAVAVGVTYAMLTSWRFTTSAITRSVLITGIVNNLAKIGLAMAVVPFASVRVLNAGDQSAALSASFVSVAAIITIVVFFLHSVTAAMFAGRTVGIVVDGARHLFRTEPLGHWDERGERFRTESRELLSDRWIALTLSAVASQLSLYVVLLASVRVVGAGGSAVDVLVVFAAVRLVTALPLTPGAVGVAEVGYVAGLAFATGGAGSEILAAVIIFRVATWLLPTLVGFGALVTWSLSSSRSPVDDLTDA